jgi:hypothetical protein
MKVSAVALRQKGLIRASTSSKGLPLRGEVFEQGLFTMQMLTGSIQDLQRTPQTWNGVLFVGYFAGQLLGWHGLIRRRAWVAAGRLDHF